MSNEIPRRSFFSAMAFSPLALLGLRKQTADIVEESESHWKVVAKFNRIFADHWRGRVLAAEADADIQREMRENCEKVINYRSKNTDYWCDRTLAAEKKLEQVERTPDEDISSGQIKGFSTVDDMLDSLNRDWDGDEK
ncbi:MAG: hypothetical protein IID46_04685 [Planctomycetes bacterium]|nr:hypothetical protein [Planctomycetota bacterium]